MRWTLLAVGLLSACEAPENYEGNWRSVANLATNWDDNGFATETCLSIDDTLVLDDEHAYTRFREVRARPEKDCKAFESYTIDETGTWYDIPVDDVGTTWIAFATDDRYIDLTDATNVSLPLNLQWSSLVMLSEDGDDQRVMYLGGMGRYLEIP